jgi:hypothetical protein
VYTRRCIEFFRANNLRPISTQVPLIDERQRIVTWADLVGVRVPPGHRDSSDPLMPTPDTPLFLCELKTGFDVGYQRGQNPMTPPLDRVSGRDSQANQHQLQLGWMASCAQRMYDTAFDEAFILLVSRKQKNKASVRRMDLKSWVRTHQDTLNRLLEQQARAGDSDGTESGDRDDNDNDDDE